MRYDIPQAWQRCGLILAYEQSSDGPCRVAGDPCVVWDDDLPGWRMVLFFNPPGHAQAVCRTPDDVGPGRWQLEGPLPFTNPADILGGYTHKPYIVMDAHRPNRAARVDGQYRLLTVSNRDGHKVIQRAAASTLAGPWTVEPEPVIDVGAEGDFDGRHVDAVSGFHFAERGASLYFYMGYPARPQARAISPYGSAQAVAMQGDGERTARKLGMILPPCQQAGHWASGYLGGVQILPGIKHRWIAIVNASPTAPNPTSTANHRLEPPPSLGGFAWCDEEWPVHGWQWCSEPIEWIEQVPADAIRNGEGVNLWRHHILCLADGRMALLYNSGPYGREQLYMKIAAPGCVA